ncbi:MAG: DUF1566 domain-containing protein [Candidatus Cloacimonetes bacterium]|nr:DUF1566 domain-containing protein [Candidatus Cloacimonadota bacterium]
MTERLTLISHIVVMFILSCSHKTTKESEVPPLLNLLSTVTISITHNYYADEADIPINVWLANTNDDPLCIYADTTVENCVAFPFVRYGSYELTVSNNIFSPYTTYVSIDSLIINHHVRLSVLGSSGGFVFYDKGYVSEGWRYIEAATITDEFVAQWSSRYGRTGGTSTLIGTGKQNTQNIIDWSISYGLEDYAALFCFEINEIGEWFLPSIDELHRMYQNLHARNVGDFSALSYWSSSECNVGTAVWYIHFGNGEQYDNLKSNEYKVRAARYF